MGMAAEDWLRSSSSGIEQSALDARLKSVGQIASTADTSMVLDLVRLAHGGLTVPTDESIAKLTAPVTKVDPTFEPSRTSFELQGMAAATLSKILGRKDQVAVVAALAAESAQMVGLRPSDRATELFATAEEWVRNRSRSLRSSDAVPATTAATKAVSFTEWEAAATTGDTGKLSELLPGLVAKLTAADSARVARVEALAQDWECQLRTLREELECLWWLLDGRSNRLGLRFAELSRQQGSLILAFELFERFSVIPLPESASEIVRQALDLSRRKSAAKPALRQLVEAARPDLQIESEGLVRQLGSPALTPLLWGIASLSSEQADGEAKQITGLDYSVDCDEHQAATQLLIELSLVRLAGSGT